MGFLIWPGILWAALVYVLPISSLYAETRKPDFIVGLCDRALKRVAGVLRGDQRRGPPLVTLSSPKKPERSDGSQNNSQLSIVVGPAPSLAFLLETPGLLPRDQDALRRMFEPGGIDRDGFLSDDREYFKSVQAKDVNRAITDFDLEALVKIFSALDVTTSALSSRDYYELTALSINWNGLLKLVEDNMFFMRSGMPGGMNAQVLKAVLEELEKIFNTASDADLSSEYSPDSNDSWLVKLKKRSLKLYHQKLREQNEQFYEKFSTAAKELDEILKRGRPAPALPKFLKP